VNAESYAARTVARDLGGALRRLVHVARDFLRRGAPAAVIACEISAMRPMVPPISDGESPVPVERN